MTGEVAALILGLDISNPFIRVCGALAIGTFVLELLNVVFRDGRSTERRPSKVGS